MPTHAIQPGEPLPAGEPMRIVTRNGYIRLRWNLGGGSFVEIFEHRLVVGIPSAEFSVHHKNHIKTDNRPENLEVILKSDHSKLHHPVSVDVGFVAAQYLGGKTLPELAAEHGVDGGNLSRLLRRYGVTMRTSAESRRASVDTKRIREMHDAGCSIGVIAREFGVGQDIIRRRCREMSLPSRPVGRPRLTYPEGGGPAVRTLIAVESSPGVISK